MQTRLWLTGIAVALLCQTANAMAQDNTPFRGNWLGNGCFSHGLPFVISVSVRGDTMANLRMIDNKGLHVMESDATATYRVVNGATTLFASYNGID